MKPTFQILAAGNDVSSIIGERLISLEITDSVDENSDGITLTIEDVQGSLAIPASGTKLEISIGYDGNNQRIGSFVVDEVSVEGPPDIISISASSSPFVSDRAGGGAASFNSRKSRSFEGKTIQEIVETIAGECGLTAAVDSTLGKIKVDHIVQTGESDANFLIRIARKFGGVLKPADGRLVMSSEAGGKTLSGAALELTITPADVSSWRLSLGGKTQAVTAVKVKKYDYKSASVTETVAKVPSPQFALPEDIPLDDSEVPPIDLPDGMVLPPLQTPLPP